MAVDYGPTLPKGTVRENFLPYASLYAASEGQTNPLLFRGDPEGETTPLTYRSQGGVGGSLLTKAQVSSG